MVDAHKNLAVSTVATAPSPAASGTSLVVAAGEGARFPAAPFNATVWPSNADPTPDNAEIIRVTAISTDTFTITRAQESITAKSIAVGWKIAATITAKSLTDIETEKFDRSNGTLIPVAGATYAANKLFADSDNDSLTYMNSISAVALQIGYEGWTRVKNNTGSTIANGAAVYINGVDGMIPTIALAQANDATKTVVHGIATHAIANGATGVITNYGIVRGVDTSAYTANANLYLSPTTPGGLTSTVPTGNAVYRFRIGSAVNINAATGQILVQLGQGTRDSAFERGLPTYAGTPFGPFDPRLGLYNGKASLFKKTHAALMKAANGTSSAHFVVTGDSGGVGFNGSAVVYANSFPVQMGKALAAITGIPYLGGFNSPVVASATMNNQWAVTSGTINNTTYGGMIAINSGSSVTFTSDDEGTGFDIYCTELSFNGFTYQIDGGTAQAVTTTGAAAYKKVSTITVGRGKHTLRINNPGGAGTFVFLSGASSTDSIPGLYVHNLCWGGAKANIGTAATNWSDTTTNASLYMNRKLGFDAAGITPALHINHIGANDMTSGNTAAGTMTGIQNMRAFWSSADFLMIGSGDLSGTDQNIWDEFCRLRYAYADSAPAALLDCRYRFGTYADALANGLLGPDNAHAINAVSQQIGRLLAATVESYGMGTTSLDPVTSGFVSRDDGGREAVAAADGTTGTVNLWLSQANIFTLTPTGNVTTLNLLNVPASGQSVTVTLIVTQGATPRTIATPAGGVFYGAATPTQVANKRCIFTYQTTDGGTTWHCSGVVQV